MTDEDIAKRAAAALVHLVGSRTEIIFGRPLYRNRNPQWEGRSSILFVPFGGEGEAVLEAEKFRKLLADEFVAAIHEARRQLPLESPVGGDRVEEIKRVRKDGPWNFRDSGKRCDDLLAYIDHLEKMLAFVMIDQEGERAAELLAMAKCEGRLEVIEKLRDMIDDDIESGYKAVPTSALKGSIASMIEKEKA